MNIKIKASGVYCLIGDDYDKIYMALKRQLGESEEQIFTERKPGHEYLQWSLPGEGWTALSECDPLMDDAVRKELSRRCQAILTRFGDNQMMAQKILSYPDDAYVFYKADDSGRIMIKLTAWGYRYPERIGDSAATGEIPPPVKAVPVAIKLMYDGTPMAGKGMKLNGFLRTTNSNGVLEIGQLPVGYQFDVDVDKVHEHIVVSMGQEEIVLDLTEFAVVQIKALLNDKPYGGAKVGIRYGSKSLDLVCDGNGVCTTSLPLDLDKGECAVSIDEQTQRKSLEESVNVFKFSVEKMQEDPELPILEPPAIREKQVEIRAHENDSPCQGLMVFVFCVNEERTLYTDENGMARTSFAVSDDLQTCTVIVDNEKQQKALSEPLTVFDFEFIRRRMEDDPGIPVQSQADIEVHAMQNGRPYGGAAVRIQYKGRDELLHCDESGILLTSLPYQESDELCYVSVGAEVQKKALESGLNQFYFDLPSIPDPPVETSPVRWYTYLLMGLFTLLLAALVAATYMIGGRFLFG